MRLRSHESELEYDLDVGLRALYICKKGLARDGGERENNDLIAAYC